MELLKLTPFYDLFGKRSFSQSGEDIMVDSLLGRPKTGFYVDIGAYHPKIFSNTYMFYKRGWRGVCVEPNPQMKWLHRVVRPRDVFVDCGVAVMKPIRGAQNPYSRVPVSGKPRMDMFRADLVSTSVSDNIQELEYFVFDEEATNTFSAEQVKMNLKVGRKLLKTIKVPVCSLREILERSIPRGQKVDLLSIDVEGVDLEILKSNDWVKFRPKIVVCEETKGGVVEFLKSKGYTLVGMTGYSMILSSGEK